MQTLHEQAEILFCYLTGNKFHLWILIFFSSTTTLISIPNQEYSRKKSSFVSSKSLFPLSYFTSRSIISRGWWQCPLPKAVLYLCPKENILANYSLRIHLQDVRNCDVKGHSLEEISKSLLIIPGKLDWEFIQL